jgi:hypothetical protein
MRLTKPIVPMLLTKPIVPTVPTPLIVLVEAQGQKPSRRSTVPRRLSVRLILPKALVTVMRRQ